MLMREAKLLLVDDESVHQLAIMDIIEASEKDYEVLSAFNGREALIIALKERPDLIITDWEMPEMNGIEFIQLLRADERLTHIPVIMCTGRMTDSEHLHRALEAGANDYVRKPIDAIELMARVNANLHLAEKYAQIKMLNATKDKIFSMISHDLRGPVGTIKGLTDVMLDHINSYSSEKIEHIISMVNKQCSTAYSVLENLLLWSLSQQHEIKSKPQRQALALAITQNVDLFDSLAEQKGVLIKNNIPDDVMVTYDLDLIATVVRNLMSNAIKFSNPGGFLTLDLETGKDFCTITVSDTGVGIKDELIDLIFDKTEYNSTFGTNNEKGSGLGLKLCQEFVEIHRGEIGVKSEVGRGSAFYFTLPL